MTLYLDTSSAIKLYVSETGSDVVHARWATPRSWRQLRGFDSVHLATFAAVAQRAGLRDTRFSSVDDRLNLAAQKLARRLDRQS